MIVIPTGLKAKLKQKETAIVGCSGELYLGNKVYQIPLSSVVGSLTREKGQNDGGSGENFEGAQMFVSRLIQQYIYPSFSYDQFNWNIMLSFPWTSTDFDLTFQNNLVGADQYNISIIKDKELALKANLLTATIPSFEVESSYIVPIVKQLMALFRYLSFFVRLFIKSC